MKVQRLLKNLSELVPSSEGSVRLELHHLSYPCLILELWGVDVADTDEKEFLPNYAAIHRANPEWLEEVQQYICTLNKEMQRNENKALWADICKAFDRK